MYPVRKGQKKVPRLMPQHKVSTSKQEGAVSLAARYGPSPWDQQWATRLPPRRYLTFQFLLPSSVHKHLT